MRLSFSTNAFVRTSVFDAVERIAAAGYEGVELLADTPHLYAPAVSGSDLERLKDLLGRHHLQVTNINANTAVGYYGREFWEPLFEPSLANPDPEARRWRIDYSRRCIDLACRLGAPCVSVTSGRMVPGVLPDESLELLCESLGEVAGYAAERGIRVGIEYEPGLLVERFTELQALIHRVGSPALGANLDLGHSHVLGEDPGTVVRGLGSRLFHIHLEDIRSHKHYHLIPGNGDMDIQGILDLLETCGYDGFITVELYTYPHRPDEAARQAWHVLQGLRHGKDSG